MNPPAAGDSTVFGERAAERGVRVGVPRSGAKSRDAIEGSWESVRCIATSSKKLVGWRPLLRSKKLLVAPGISTSNKKLLYLL